MADDGTEERRSKEDGAWIPLGPVVIHKFIAYFSNFNTPGTTTARREHEGRNVTLMTKGGLSG